MAAGGNGGRPRGEEEIGRGSRQRGGRRGWGMCAGGCGGGVHEGQEKTRGAGNARRGGGEKAGRVSEVGGGGGGGGE